MNEYRYVAPDEDVADNAQFEQPAGRPVVAALVAVSLILTGLLLCWWLWQSRPGAQAQAHRAHIERMIAQHECAEGETVSVIDRGGWYKLTCEGGQHGRK